MIYEAGFVSFFRTLLIIVLIYYGVKFLLRFIMPFLLKYLFKKQFSSYNQSFDHANRGTSQNKERKPEKEDRLGEYVDYEEVE